MKTTFSLIQFSLCASLWAAGPETLVPVDRQLANIEERRAEAMGKRLECFETMAGRVYQDVRITKISDAGISFSHADGAVRLRFADLSPEQRRYFGISREDAATIYARELKARENYERKVEEKENARRELAEKEAAERAELERLAMEKAEQKQTAAAEIESTETIPLYPTIKRVDSIRRSSSRHSSYRSYYGGFRYSYPVRFNCRPTYRHRGRGCRPVFGTGIHFSVR